MNIIEALEDDALIGGWLGPLDTWAAWLAILKGAFCLPLTKKERATFRRLTNRKPPKRRVRELWISAGRRSGKSVVVAAVAAFYAAFGDYRGILKRGEMATIFVIAADRAQSRNVFRYLRAILAGPMFAPLIVAETKESITLSTGVIIEVGTCSHRSLRGYSCPLVVCDEIAHWRSDETMSPDAEVLAALRPSQATFPEPMLIAISTPYAKRGVLWRTYRKYYGQVGDVLVVKAGSMDLNPTLDRREIEKAIAEDPSAASAEWLGEFRNDIESFVAVEVVDAVTVPGRRELPPVAGVSYVGFCDPSGGSSDSMTIAIGHMEDRVAVLDAIRERKPPFSPADVVAEFAALLKSYHLSAVTGDRYAGEWPREVFQNAGITYFPSAKPKSDIYRDSLAMLNSGSIELLDHPKLATQLVGLERRTARGGRDSIDHAPGSHDDVCNAALGVVVELGRARPVPMIWQSDDLALPSGNRPGVPAARYGTEYDGGNFDSFIRGD